MNFCRPPWLPPDNRQSCTATPNESGSTVINLSNRFERIIAISSEIVVISVLPIVMQFLHLQDLTATLKWLLTFPEAYTVNLGVITILFLCMFTIFNSACLGTMVTILVCMMFSVIDAEKMRVLHQPLLPADLAFFKQALQVALIYSGQAAFGCFTLAILVVGTLVLRGKVTDIKLKTPVRIVAILVLGTTLYSGIKNFSSVVRTIYTHSGIINEYWDQLANYEKNGVLYGFLLNLESLKIVKPAQYDRASMERLFFSDPVTVAPPASTPDRRTPLRPDIIIYMNESFWDISQITTIKPPRDPIPVFHSLGKKCRRTHLISPTFGGNTCLAEFEFLTGMPNSFFPPGSIAYNQFIRRPVPSFVRVCGENGYKTIAIHDYKRWFWNRVNVFRCFGFGEFIGDDSMKQEPLKGTYISDEALANIIVRHASRTDTPVFIYAASMQNHGHYSYKRYDSLDCPVNTGLSATADLEYNTYLQGAIDADKSLKIVVNYIKSAKKPTVVFFFGDHLPGFTHLYRESGMEDRFKAQKLLSRTTTAVWYANFTLPHENDTTVSMPYIPLLLARAARLDVPDYYRFLDNIKMDYPVYTGVKRFDAMGKLIPATPETESQDDAVRMIMYDAYFGKRHAEKHYHLNPDAR